MGILVNLQDLGKWFEAAARLPISGHRSELWADDQPFLTAVASLR
jgi:hypothetical protein